MTTLTPNVLPSDAAEWLAQVHRKKEQLAVAIGSMPWAPKHMLDMLDYVEQTCINTANARYFGGK